MSEATSFLVLAIVIAWAIGIYGSKKRSMEGHSFRTKSVYDGISTQCQHIATLLTYSWQYRITQQIHTHAPLSIMQNWGGA